MKQRWGIANPAVRQKRASDLGSPWEMLCRSIPGMEIPECGGRRRRAKVCWTDKILASVVACYWSRLSTISSAQDPLNPLAGMG